VPKISAIAFGRGYMRGFMCSALLHLGYVVYPSSCNVNNVSVGPFLGLAYQMDTYIKTPVCVQFSTCSEGKMLYTIQLTYSLLIS